MIDRESFTLRLVSREDRTRSQLDGLYPVGNPSGPKAVAILPTEGMTSEDFVFLRRQTSTEIFDAEEIILEFIDAAQAYLVLEDLEKVSIFTGRGREKPVAADLWAMRGGRWTCIEEDVWFDPLWQYPDQLAEHVQSVEA